MDCKELGVIFWTIGCLFQVRPHITFDLTVQMLRFEYSLKFIFVTCRLRTCQFWIIGIMKESCTSHTWWEFSQKIRAIFISSCHFIHCQDQLQTLTCSSDLFSFIKWLNFLKKNSKRKLNCPPGKIKHTSGGLTNWPTSLDGIKKN